MIFPVRSLLALKFLYIWRRLIVPFVLGFATPFKPDLGLSGFIEWFDLLKPCFRGAPEALRTFGIFCVLCLAYFEK